MTSAIYRGHKALNQTNKQRNSRKIAYTIGVLSDVLLNQIYDHSTWESNIDFKYSEGLSQAKH